MRQLNLNRTPGIRNFAAAAAFVLVLFAENIQAQGTGTATGSHADRGESAVRIEPLDSSETPDVTENPPPDVAQALLERAAPALATTIRESRRQALARGVESIPPNIRAALEAYFPAQILDKAKWTMAGGISLDGMLVHWFYLEGAVTLGEVIAFTHGEEAQEDVELWAHELTHVMQYEQLGIDNFAVEYLDDFSRMENEASSNATRIMASVEAAE